MKIMTFFGTRPELIKLSLVLKVLDQHCEHTTVHTGQSTDENLSDVFIRDLEIRTPDIHLGIDAKSVNDQAARILSKADQMFEQHQPDRVLILGATNSVFAGLAAVHRQVPVYHMEAGYRCYDGRNPEEINRRMLDHCSTVLLPFTDHGRENLLGEGIHAERIFVTGSPVKEVLDTFADGIEDSGVMKALGVKPFEYFLVTLHKAENIDDQGKMGKIFEGFSKVADKFGKTVLVAAHPRTAERIEQYDIRPASSKVRLLKALNLFDFVKLEKNSLAVLTDSGTVQEECCILGVPNITIRDVTDRPETIDCGSNILSGTNPDAIVRSVELAIAQPAAWIPPHEYTVTNVSQTVSRILLGSSR